MDIFGTTKLSPTLRLSFLAFLAFLVKIGAKIAGKIVIFDFLEFFFSDFGYQKKSNFLFFFFVFFIFPIRGKNVRTKICNEPI